MRNAEGDTDVTPSSDPVPASFPRSSVGVSGQ